MDENHNFYLKSFKNELRTNNIEKFKILYLTTIWQNDKETSKCRVYSNAIYVRKLYEQYLDVNTSKNYVDIEFLRYALGKFNYRIK